MSGNRSVISVDIDDSRFREFVGLFQKYQEALRQQPNLWGTANEQMGQTREILEVMAASMLTQIDLLHRMTQETRQSEHAARGWRDALHGGLKHAKELTGYLTTITHFITHEIKVAGAVTGLLGFGGLWGLDRLSQAATTLRTSSMGLGVNPAAMQALGISFGPFMNVPGALGATIQAQQDATKRWVFSAMGIPGAATLSPDQALQQEMIAARNLYQQTPEAVRTQTLQARGVLDVFSMEEVRRLAAMSPQEFQQHLRQVGRDERALAYPPGVLKAWSDLTIKLDEAKTTIEAAFIRGLAPLSPELQKLSGAFSTAVSNFLESKTVKTWIGDLDVALKHFTDWIGTPAFQKSVENFVFDLEALTSALASFLNWVAHHLPKSATGLGAVGGAVGGAIVGGVVGGPPGAVVGGVLGAAVGATLAGPPGASQQQQEYAQRELNNWFAYQRAHTMTGEGPPIYTGIPKEQWMQGYEKAHPVPAHSQSSLNLGPIKGLQTGSVADQIAEQAKRMGASPSATAALFSAALGEGGVWQAWKPGDHLTSFGPWQLHQGGELDKYLASGGRPGNVAQETAYVLSRLRQIDPNFDRASVAQQFRDILAFEKPLHRTSAYYQANLPLAQRILAQLHSGSPSSIGAAQASAKRTIHPTQLARGGAFRKVSLDVNNNTGGSAIVTTPSTSY